MIIIWMVFLFILDKKKNKESASLKFFDLTKNSFLRVLYSIPNSLTLVSKSGSCIISKDSFYTSSINKRGS